jgi:hypothetical protein
MRMHEFKLSMALFGGALAFAAGCTGAVAAGAEPGREISGLQDAHPAEIGVRSACVVNETNETIAWAASFDGRSWETVVQDPGERTTLAVASDFAPGEARVEIRFGSNHLGPERTSGIPEVRRLSYALPASADPATVCRVRGAAMGVFRLDEQGRLDLFAVEGGAG